MRFLGLVEFGRDVTAAELRSGYDAVVYAVGAADDRRLGLNDDWADGRDDIWSSPSVREC